MVQEALPTLKVLLEAPSALVSRKVAMYVFYALKLREEKITYANEYNLVCAAQVLRLLI